MSEIRQRIGSWCCCVLLGLVWLTFQAVPAWGNPPSAATGYRGFGRQGPVVILSDEFFQAMQKFANSSGEVYGDRQEFFLEQIATAERFVVKTNLKLIEQNEKIIRLLEDLKSQGQKESR
jgi:hypothetical protein